MDIENFPFQLAIVIRVLDSCPYLVNQVLHPFTLDGHCQDEFIVSCQQLVYIFLAVETFIQHQVQFSQFQIAESL